MIITDGLQPSDEWQTGADGRRFHFDGRCVEYEPKIMTSTGTLTEEQLHRMNAAKESRTFTPAPSEPSKRCPFKTGARKDCGKDDCAWWSGGKCAQSCPHPAAGRKCPHKGTVCTYDCALRSDNE